MVSKRQEESEHYSNLGKRLRDARISLGLSQDELAKRWNLERNYIYLLESGKKKFPPKRLPMLLELERMVRDKLSSIANKMDTPAAFQEDSDPYGPAISSLPPRRKVPLVSWARQGLITERGLNYADLEGFIDEQVETDCKDPAAFALILEGDSMEPAYMAGDRVVFAPHEEPRNGDVVVARLRETGQVLFKRFFRTGPEGEKVRLESYNHAYSPKEYDIHDFRFIYPAVDMVRKIRR